MRRPLKTPPLTRWTYHDRMLELHRQGRAGRPLFVLWLSDYDAQTTFGNVGSFWTEDEAREHVAESYRDAEAGPTSPRRSPMTSLVTSAKPEDWLSPQFNPDNCVLTEAFGGLGEVSNAATHTRSQAITRYLAESGDGPSRSQVQCRVAYIGPLTRQDAWEEYGAADAEHDWMVEHSMCYSPDGKRVVDSTNTTVYPPVPDRVPDEWDAGTPWADWRICKPSDQNAVKVYICEAAE